MSENVPNEFDRVQVDKSSWAWMNIIGQSIGKALNATSAVFTGTVSAAAGTSAGHLVRRDQTNIDGNSISAYRATDQSVTSGVTTKVSLDTEYFDIGSKFDSTTNYRWTPDPGYYLITWEIDFQATGTTITTAYSLILKNGAGINVRGGLYAGAAITRFISTGSHIMYLNGTDYIELHGNSTATSPVFATGSRMSGILIYR